MNLKDLKAIHEIHSIQLEKEEKEKILQNILRAQGIKNNGSRQHSYFYTWTFWLKQNSFPLVLVLFFALTATGRGMASAAYKSLPGDSFYSMKVNMIEPLKGNLISSMNGKLDHEYQLIINRLKETEVLMQTGDIGSSVKQQIVTLLNRHSTALLALEKEGGSETAKAVKNKFNKQLTEHVKYLSAISTKSPRGSFANEVAVIAAERASMTLPKRAEGQNFWNITAVQASSSQATSTASTTDPASEQGTTTINTAP